MFSSLAFSERPFCDQAILLAGVAEMSGLSSTAFVALGVFSGTVDVSSIFTQTSNAIYISSANAELSSNAITTSAGTRIRLGTSEAESAFTKTSNGIMIGSGEATKTFIMTQTTNGEIKFVEVNASATPESYTTITPSGTETYTEITPSGTETWTEIQ